MQSFHYEARNPKTGQLVSAEVTAESEQAAAKLIRAEGLAPIKITSSESDSKPGLFKKKIKAKDRILLSRQLSTLINAGLPLIQSLRSVAEQSTSKPLKAVVNHIVSDVEAGSTLSAALSKYPEVFDQVYISMVAAGETSGTLDKSLERLAIQQEKDAAILSKVRGAMVYPVIVLIVMGAVVTFMIVSVLPQVETLYADLPGASLPLLTRIMLGLSHLIISFWWIAVIMAIGAIAFLRHWVKTLNGRKVIDRMKMKMWPVGPLFMKMYMARFSRTGTTLVASGVPLIQVLEVAGRAINNIHLETSLKQAIDKVKGGKSLSDAIKDDKNFLPLVPSMLKIGEQSGAIEQMMDKMAEYYERELDEQIRSISTIIEPVLMILLGVFAFLIVAAVLLPIYGLAGKTLN